MVKRVCRHCPIAECGAKYLVRLANHLADVHLLDINQRRKYLQEAKLQPKTKFVVYQNTTDEKSANNTPKIQERVFELSQPRQCNIRKTTKTRVKQDKRNAAKTNQVRGKLKNWLTMH